MKWNGRFTEVICSVRSPSTTEIMHSIHSSHRAETELLWKDEVGACSICKVIFIHSLSGWRAFAGNWPDIAGLSTYYQDINCLHCLLLKKSRSACSTHGTKSLCLIWAKWHTALCIVVSPSACSTMLLSASNAMTLPSACEKLSPIAWTIKIFPSPRCVFLGRSQVLSSYSSSLAGES